MLRPKTLSEAIETMNTLSYGNGATIFTSSGASARQFIREIQAGMLGVNVGGMNEGRVSQDFWLLISALFGLALLQVLVFKLFRWF